MEKFLINQAVTAFENYVRASNLLDDYEYEFLDFYFDSPTVMCKAYSRFMNIISWCSLLTNKSESEIYLLARKNCKVDFIEREEIYNRVDSF